MVQWSESVWGGDGWGGRLLWAGEDEPQGFLYRYIRKVDERLAGGAYIFIKSTPIVLGSRPLMSIGYKYNYRKVQGFIAA